MNSIRDKKKTEKDFLETIKALRTIANILELQKTSIIDLDLGEDDLENSENFHIFIESTSRKIDEKWTTANNIMAQYGLI